MGQLVDETGNRYGRLLVERRAAGSYTCAYWQCVCDCGEISMVAGGNLRKGHTTSCGCKNSEVASARKITHGMSRFLVYSVWTAINYRCFNSTHARYPSYGGRGITVCKRWRIGTENAFENFLSDMGRKPSKDHSVDRINNDGPYSPENCRWATMEEQQNNRRDNVLITYQKRTKGPVQWAKELGMDVQTIRTRLRSGWTDAQVLGFEKHTSLGGNKKQLHKK